MAKRWDYDAFISYRHLPLDLAVAERTQKLLESYKAPRRLGEGQNAGSNAFSEIGPNCLPAAIWTTRSKKRFSRPAF